MAYSLISFVPSNNLELQQYVTAQLNSIAEAHPDLIIEQVDETDSRLALYFKNTNRFPAYLVFKDGVRKGKFQLKVELPAFTDWVSSNLS